MKLNDECERKLHFGNNQNDSEGFEVLTEDTNIIPFRVFEAFAGYGSQHLALQELADLYSNFNFKVVGISEIDETAIKAYKILHGDGVFNYGDISTINWKEVPNFNVFTYSFPCQDISLNGNQQGFEKGSNTRSSLLWECKRAIELKKPKYLLMENVKNITCKKYKKSLDEWISVLSGLGYTSFNEIMNASDFGIPQHRERFIMISILGKSFFEFPKSQKITENLNELLEKNVKESFYLKKVA